MNTVIYASQNLLPLWIILGLLGFFGFLVIVIILVKRRFSNLQIKKEDIPEEEAVRQELDRILVPIEDEKIQEQMKSSEDEENK